jgi:ABC-type sugar transport system substrate-binding protein
MKKVLLVAVALFVVAGLCFAGGAKEAAAKEEITIAVIPLALGHPWWVRCEEGAKRAGKELGINIVFTAPEKEDAAKQLDVFNDQVNKGVSAILLAAVDSEVMKQPIVDSNAKGVPVFGFDIGAPGTETVWLASGFEPATSGKRIAEKVAEEIGNKGKVAVITGTLGSPYLKLRQDNMEAVFNSHADIEIIGRYANDNDMQKALTQCESILQAHPDLAGFCSTVTTTATAAVQALVNAGKQGKVSVGSTAMPQMNAEYVKKGWANALLTLDPAAMTGLGVYIAYNYITTGALPKEGDKFPDWIGKPLTVPAEKVSYVEDLFLTPENVDELKF